MARDIDQIITSVKKQFPKVRIVQMDKVHPADDDGLWWFRLPGESKDVQIESSTGECPFLIETDEWSSKDAVTAHTIEDAVNIISSYLVHLTGK